MTSNDAHVGEQNWRDDLDGILSHIQVFLDRTRTGDFAFYWQDATGRAKYRPSERPITNVDLKKHLGDGPYLGFYLTEPNSDETRVAAFDLDDHSGDSNWEDMRTAAATIIRIAEAKNLHAWALRSGGGKGIHLLFWWHSPQKIAVVRTLMRAILSAAGFKPGTAGIAQGQIEIFPKSNHVQGYGALLAIPFGRKSIPLDNDCMPSGLLVPRSSDPVSDEGNYDEPAPIIFGVSEHLLADIAEALNFISSDSYERWVQVGFGLKRGLGESGFALWDSWSKKSANYPGESETRRKWSSDLPNVGAISLETVVGWARGAGWKGRAEQKAEWPKPLEEAAFYGIAGEVVRTIEPDSEADPAALLLQLLAAVGNCCGRAAYFLVEGDKHYSNLFVTVVGRTAKARKGTSWGRIRALFEQMQDEWIIDRVDSGLSSGEGLIWAVRDAIEKMIDGEVQVVDDGVSDKRLLVQESELAGLLRVMQREGNTVSRVIRDAWDRGNLSTMTKTNAAKATGAHISIVAHITVEELIRYLDRTETSNGFANRFLFVCASRSKLLPFGGAQAFPNALAQELADAIGRQRNKGPHRLTFSEEAAKRWVAIYRELSNAKPGLLGSITARGEAHILRLALIYAMLDGSAEISLDHLEAGLAIWRYAEASAAHIFGSASGDPVADPILKALRDAGAKGLTRTALSALFGGHKTSASVGQALDRLAGQNLAKRARKETGGRPTETWFAN